MPAITDAQHAELGALHRKAEQIRGELRGLRGRTDPGAVNRAANLQVALDKLSTKQTKLQAAIERQEAAQRMRGLRRDRESLVQLLRSQGVDVADPPDFPRVDGATRDSDLAPAASSIAASAIQLEGGADQDRRFDAHADRPLRLPPKATVERGESFARHHVVRSAITAEQQRYGEMHFGRYVRGLATGEWQGADAEQRAMSEGVLAAGGYTVPVELSSQIIDLARNEARVFQAGAQTVPMSTQTLNIARMTGDPSAAFRAENTAITASDATFDQVTLKAKTLAALTVVSRELLEDSINVDDALRTAFAAQAALTIDGAALYGSGVDPEPRGVRNTTGITVESMGTDGAALTNWDRIIDTAFALPDNNEALPSALIYSPRTARTIAKFTDTTGQPLQVPPDLAGIPRLVTGQVPNDLTQGTSNDASELYAGVWSHLLVGLRTRFQVRVLTERYAELGQVAFLTWWRGDVAVARPGAFAVLAGITP